MCGQHNVIASAGDNTGQNTDKGHTPNPRTDIKIHDPAGNRNRVAALEGRDFTDQATATDPFKFASYIYFSIQLSYLFVDYLLLYILQV